MDNEKEYEYEYFDAFGKKVSKEQYEMATALREKVLEHKAKLQASIKAHKFLDEFEEDQ